LTYIFDSEIKDEFKLVELREVLERASDAAQQAVETQTVSDQISDLENVIDQTKDFVVNQINFDIRLILHSS